MSEFFEFSLYNNINMTLAEKVVPFVLLVVLLLGLFIMVKRKVPHKKMLIIFKITNIIFIINIILQYYFTYLKLGLNKYTLPLHICGISSLLIIFSYFKAKESIIKFLIIIAVPCSLSVFLEPATGGGWRNFQYISFMIEHILLIFIPIFYLFVYKYFPTVRDICKSIIIFLTLVIIMCIINTMWGTNYMFVSLTKNPYKEGIIAAMGEAPYYNIVLVLVGTIILGIWGIILQGIRRKYDKNDKQHTINN